MSSTTRTGGWSASSSRTSTTRSVLPAPSGIVSPELQFGTALVSVGGSAAAPSLVSSLNRNVIRFSSPGPDGEAECTCCCCEEKALAQLARIDRYPVGPAAGGDEARVRTRPVQVRRPIVPAPELDQ